MPGPDPERRRLGNVFRGHRATSALGELLVPSAPILAIDATAVTRLDAYGGAVVRTGVDVHLARHAEHLASLIEPRDDASWELLWDLLGGFLLPLRCSWAGTRSPGKRGSQVLVPATPITDDEDVQLLVDHTIRQATGALGYGDRAGRLLQEAAAVFLENAKQHTPGAGTPPVVCAALEPQGNDLQLATVSLGGPVPDQADGEAALRRALTGGPNGSSSLTDLVAVRRGGLDASVRLAWGTGRARYRTSDSWRFSTSTDVPGFIAGVEVHR
jgi:hypothetical protein